MDVKKRKYISIIITIAIIKISQRSKINWSEESKFHGILFLLNYFWLYRYIYISNPLISFPRKFRNFSYKILFSPLNSKSTHFTFFHLGSFVTILFHPTNLSLEFLRYTLKNFWNNRRSFISIFASQIFFSPEKFFSTSSFFFFLQLFLPLFPRRLFNYPQREIRLQQSQFRADNGSHMTRVMAEDPYATSWRRFVTRYIGA